MERLEGYEKDITTQYKKRVEFEVNRHILDTNGRHNKHHAIIKEWKERKKFMTSDRGVWGGDGNKTPLYWKRDTHENYTRMRLRTCPNNEFNPHNDAKFYDEYDVLREESSVNLLGVSEEARIRADKETQESWEVVMNNNIPDVTDDEQLIFFEDCHLVTLLNIIPGTLKVSPTHIYFYEHEKDETHHKLSHNNLVWKIKDIREIHLRRYNLRYSAIEFFLTDQTNHFINLSKYHRNKVYSKIMSLRPANLVHGITRTPEEMVASSNITKKWMERRISNFEYLMNLNTIAGRTYNDLSQYPVFPWVLTDYLSDSIDFESPLCECFRDFSKPIGAQIPERAEHADIKYHSLPQDGLDPPFHWGTHYSNPGAVLYYLVRMEPYTSLHIDLHGRFDHPDRHFYNINNSFNSSTRGQGDCKELIPEFFYLPEFLVNSNEFDFGTRHDGKPVGDVILPNWAKSPEDFIVKHRAALESDYVSNNINYWIDLIFGYKQRGQAAKEALNVYHYTSYEGMVDLDNEKDPKKRRALEAQISNFGQTPRQIFKEPHPKRMNLSEASSLKGSALSHVLNAPALKANAIQMGAPENPLIFAGVSGGSPNQVIERGVMDNLVTISRNGVYGIHNWLARWTGAHPFYCEKDTQLEEGVRCVSGPFSPGARTPCNLVRLSADGKVLFTAGLWDNSIRTGRVNQHEIIPLGVLYHHKNVISCMELDGKYLATGGRDTTVVIWKLLRKGGECNGLKPHPSAILYGHNSEVTCVALSQELDIVVSGSTEGIVLIHTLKQGTYIRTLVPHVPTEPDSDHFTVSFVGIASNGNLVIAGKLPSNKGGHHSVIYLYTLNGKLIKRAKLEDETSAMFLEGNRVVLGGTTGSLEIRDTDYINIKHKLRLKTGVVAVSKDPRNQHLFVTTTDVTSTTDGTEDASSAPPVLPDPEPTDAPVEAEEVPEAEVPEAEEPEETPAAEDPDDMDVKSTATHPLTSSIILATAVGTGVMLVLGRY
ncbi:neurobeachin-like protein 2 [Bolinopsis microptera]|uniref:neurobeachin-like protein 2 n=1 Tax=Bolinopsis microptera TaxID=2820187 RepID=UPI00307AA0A8